MDEPAWLSRTWVEAANADQIREHGGLPGIRDEALLESALARPRHLSSLQPQASLAALAASYGFALARNHPFFDGNKRIAFVAMNVFLILNGWEIDVPEPEVVDTMVRVADGGIDETGLGEWLRASIVPCSRP